MTLILHCNGLYFNIQKRKLALDSMTYDVIVSDGAIQPQMCGYIKPDFNNLLWNTIQIYFDS